MIDDGYVCNESNCELSLEVESGGVLLSEGSTLRGTPRLENTPIFGTVRTIQRF